MEYTCAEDSEARQQRMEEERILGCEHDASPCRYSSTFIAK